MKVAVPKEVAAGERRVALIPETVSKLVKMGIGVLVESGAGEGAHFIDSAYESAGATMVGDVARLLGEAEVVLKVQKPAVNEALGKHEVKLMSEGSVLIGFLQPFSNPDLVKMLAERNITSFSMDAIPRISRAQSMDALSSMSSIAGYKAVLMAANALGRLFPLMMTAAGTITPARVLVLGAGVAGLQAIATARRLGAVVEAFDIRPTSKQEVESLGARFIEVELREGEGQGAGGYAKELSQDSQRRERDLIHQHVKEADVVITTALIPGRPAPLLVTEEMVRGMREGSVIVDIAAEAGGNCQLTKPGTEVVEQGVTILGPLNIPSTMAATASQMYSRNISSLLLYLAKDGALKVDEKDELVRGALLTLGGQVVNAQVRKVLGMEPAVAVKGGEA